MDDSGQIRNIASRFSQLFSPDGGIGRRARLKICLSQGSAGSIPVPGTKAPTIVGVLAFRSVNLTLNIEGEIFKIIKGKTIAYIEAEYFGGQGGQQGIVWKDGNRSAEFKYGQSVINTILNLFTTNGSKKARKFIG